MPIKQIYICDTCKKDVTDKGFSFTADAETVVTCTDCKPKEKEEVKKKT